LATDCIIFFVKIFYDETESCSNDMTGDQKVLVLT